MAIMAMLYGDNGVMVLMVMLYGDNGAAVWC